MAAHPLDRHEARHVLVGQAPASATPVVQRDRRERDAIPNQAETSGGRGSIAVPFHVDVPAADIETAGYICDGPGGSASFGFSDVTLYVQSSNPRLIPTSGLRRRRRGG